MKIAGPVEEATRNDLMKANGWLAYAWAQTQDRVARLERALKYIEAWDEFPSVPDTLHPGETVSYGEAWGANGERDYMRKVAHDALSEDVA